MQTSFLQSIEWEFFQNSLGNRTLRYQDQLFILKINRIAKYWICSHGDFEQHFKVDAMPEELKKASFLRFEPRTNNTIKILQKNKQILVKTLDINPHQTSILDLHNNDEQLIKSMKSKHRYNLKIAQKNNLTSEVFSQELEKPFDRFWALHSQTADRQDFRTHEKGYLLNMIKSLSTSQMAHLVIISDQGIDLAAMILITYQGTATYLHGASSQIHREKMAPYLMHLTAIQKAREIDCQTYDFWGLKANFDPEKQVWTELKNHPSAGTSRFKLGFCGEIISFPGTYDLVLNPFWYNLYKLARRVKSKPRAFA